jgi:hypothetical protein
VEVEIHRGVGDEVRRAGDDEKRYDLAEGVSRRNKPNRAILIVAAALERETGRRKMPPRK